MQGMARIGFAGLGKMGLAMLARLAAARDDVTAWNRSPAPLQQAQRWGVRPAADFAALVGACDTILCAFANARVLDTLLQRDGAHLGVDVAGKTIIQLGTTAPESSAALAGAVVHMGGRYIEAPVSGSRIPAEKGRLVAMIGARDAADFEYAEAILPIFAHHLVRCGAPPRAMQMKLAVNCHVIAVASALAEAWHLAKTLGLDGKILRAVLNAGPMASDFSRGKLGKLLAQDWSAQASINDVLMNADLVLGMARGAGINLPVAAACRTLLASAQQRGAGDADVIAILHNDAM